MADGAGDQAEAAATSGLSAFVAKVLNQLSLSAWLPAAVFAASVTMLAEFWSHRSLSVGAAIDGITERLAPILILILPVLILSTMLTQAFSFASIRVLEGYWVRRGVISWLRTGFIRYQVSRQSGLEKRRKKAARLAFSAVRSQLLVEYSYAVVGALELQAIEEHVPELSDPRDREAYMQATWRDTCKPWHLSKVDQLDRQLKDYPELPNRMMPTRLGNVLRRTEDSLVHTGNDVQGFAMRRRELVPARVQIQHDQFRDRLDTYCTLVFVTAALSAISAAALCSRVRWYQTSGVALGFLAFAMACYGSAVASARGYCVVLKHMDDAFEPEPTTASESSAFHASCKRMRSRLSSGLRR